MMIINRSSSYRLTVLAAPATGPLLAVGAFHHYDHYDDHQHNHDNITRVIIIIIIFMITCHHINTLVLWHNWYCISGPLPPPHHHPPHPNPIERNSSYSPTLRYVFYPSKFGAFYVYFQPVSPARTA